MPSTAIFGSTGLVGSGILSTLLTSESLYSTIHTVSRREPKSKGPALQAIIEPDTAEWPARLKSISPAPTTVFSGVGTTRAQAGGIAEQWKIDHDLNVELVRAAKEAGTKTFVFISSGGTRGFPSRYAPYARMKNGVEDAIRDAGFDHGVILRPGFILGDREVAHQGGALMTGLTKGLGRWFGQGVQDCIAQEAEVIARAAVHASKIVEAGEAPSKYWVLEQSDIVRLGRTEWKS